MERANHDLGCGEERARLLGKNNTGASNISEDTNRILMPKPTDHAKIPDAVPPLPLFEFDYDDLDGRDRIGTGGDADVYQATIEHGGYTYPVAVKEPRFEGTIQSRVVEKFEDEARTWSNLTNHDNIVSVYAWGTEPLPWMGLEYMDGGTLAGHIGSLNLSQGLWLAGRIAEGVRYGHRHGVAHLDIKPTNVLLRDTGSDTWDYPKVSDWGLAKMLLEHSNSIEGVSPTYAAPEQFDSETFGNPDDFTDIYQLGTVVYAMLAGEPPFTGPSTAVMRSVLDDEPDPPSAVNPTLPDAVDEPISKALSKQKGDRYESLVMFRKELDRLFERSIAGELVTDNSSVGGTARDLGTESTQSTEPSSEAPTQPDNSAPREQETASTAKFEGTIDSGDESPLISRRSALGLAGVGVLGAGGIVAMTQTNNSGDTGPGNGGSTGGDGGDDGTESTGDGSTGGNTGAGIDESSMVLVDRQNTGFYPSTSGPREEVQERWSINFDVDEIASQPAITNGRVYTAIRTRSPGNGSGRILSVDAESGNIEWEVPIDGGSRSSPAVVNGIVYIGTFGSKVLAINAVSGQIQWEFQARDKFRSSPVIADGVLYIGSHDDNVYAIDTAEGEEIWRYETNGGRFGVRSSPAVAGDTLFVGADDTNFYALDTTTGDERWRYDGDDIFFAAPSIRDETVFAAEKNRGLYALDRQTGDLKWEFRQSDRTPIIHESTGFVGSSDGTVYALNLNNGNVEWQTNATGGISLGGGTATAETMYIGGKDNRVYAFDTETGNQLWSFSTGGVVNSIPSVVNSTVYVGSHSGTLYALEA